MTKAHKPGASCTGPEQDGDGRYFFFTCRYTSHPHPLPPPAPAPGIIISIIGVPFLQKDISPRVPKTEGVLGHFLGGPPPLHP